MTATITLVSVQADLALWLAARAAAAGGLSFSLRGRSLTRQDLTAINAMINTLSRQEANLLRARDAAGNGVSSGRISFSVGAFK